ncbi:MAG: transposase [Bacteroidales bacterium]|jgi:REP element-mobilizing transposase RayT|nr:transposase [Bacteroidales bacterium]
MDKFKNKYRIPSARLEGWDYGSNGSYFVTICTNNRECYFGDVVEGKMNLSEMGVIARDVLLDIKNNFPYVDLDTFVIMPNHIHCVICIDKKYDDDLLCNNDVTSPCRDAINRVSTNTITNTHDDNNPNTGGATKNNPMLQQNLSRIIRWYKGRTTFEIRKIHADFCWQSRFYDHIIREDNVYKTIVNYIETNPSNWEKDKLFKENEL